MRVEKRQFRRLEAPKPVEPVQFTFPFLLLWEQNHVLCHSHLRGLRS